MLEVYIFWFHNYDTTLKFMALFKTSLETLNKTLQQKMERPQPTTTTTSTPLPSIALTPTLDNILIFPPAPPIRPTLKII